MFAQATDKQKNGGIFRKARIHICHFAYKANAPEDYLLKIADFCLFLHPK